MNCFCWTTDADRGNQDYLGMGSIEVPIVFEVLVAFKEDAPAPSRRRVKKLLV